ncbi:MAG: helix-turn-helix domain-containing protein [Polyangiales bacterium]
MVKLAPSRALAPYIAHLRLLEETSAQVRALPYQRLPDGQVELTMCASRVTGGLRVVGTRLSPLRKPSHPAREFVTLRFRAGGAPPFLGVPLHALTDAMVDLDALWGDAARMLEDALGSASSREARVEAVERALLARLATAPGEPDAVPRVRRALRFVHAAEALPSVAGLADALGASARQLRRGFLDVVGVGPKQYLRVVRFQRALRAARRAPDASLATIARAMGYADQAHLNADFRALAGATPGALRRR